MSTTNFTDKVTIIEASWLNDVDALVWDICGGPTTLAALWTSIGATVNIDGGAIDGTPIGATTASTGAFTTITTTSDVDIGGDLDIGDSGTETTGIDINGTTYPKVLRVNDIGGTNPAQFIIHRHSTTLEAVSIGARSNSNDNSHGAVTAGQSIWSLYGAGYTGSHYDLFGAIKFQASASGTISSTSSPGKILIQVTADSAQTPSTAITIDQDKSTTFAGTVSFGTHSSIVAETVTGYITIKDSGGTSRKIAVVS